MMRKIVTRFTAVAMSVVLMLGATACNTDEPGDTTGDDDPAVEEPADNGDETDDTDAADSGEIDTSETVELKMYLLGDRAGDFDEVYDAINEILLEEVNATVEVEFLSWGEHETKYSLLFSGQEDFDLIFTASGWAHYETTAALGGFYELTEDFVQTYAPDIYDVVPNMAWDQARIDGKVYMVPNYQNEFGQDVLAVRGDLMDKYGIEDITNWEELIAFYKATAEDGFYASQGGPNYQRFQSLGLDLLSGTPHAGELIFYNTMDPADDGIYYLLDSEEFVDYAHTVKDLVDAGAWSADVLSSTEDRQTGLLTGRTATLTWNIGTASMYANQANAENPDWDVRLVDPVSDQPKAVNNYTNNGVAINFNSENKERAMMVLNEFYTNPAVQDLAMLGIEGKHWEAVGDDQFTLLDQSGYAVDNNSNWGWSNSEIKRTSFNENPTSIDIQREAMEEAWENNIKPPHIYDGFSFDPANVTTEVAAVEANIATYYTPLVNGLVSDVEATIAEFRLALEQAGIEAILAEVEAQTQAFWAENN